MSARNPAIEVFDASRYAGMGYYASDSAGRMAPMYRQWAAAASSEAERTSCLRSADIHDELARLYRSADAIMAEVTGALDGAP